MRKFHKPVRMCVLCKSRLFQNELVKFANINGEIIKNPRNSRSFYLCQDCLKKDNKILQKVFLKFARKTNL